MLNATNWKELKKQLRQIQGKAIFKLERVDSMNDGTFYRVLHQVKLHEIVFFDGKQKVYLQVDKETENNIEFIENGFKIGNCTYTLEKVQNAWKNMRIDYQIRYARMCRKVKENEFNTDNHGALMEMSYVLIEVFGLTSKQVDEVERNNGFTDEDMEVD